MVLARSVLWGVWCVVTCAAALACGDGMRDGVVDCRGREQVHAGTLRVAGEGDRARSECIEYVTGDVEVIGTDLETLAILGGLVHVGGDLVIEDNAALEDVGALARLVEVSGDLRIVDNASLASLQGMLLDAVGGAVTVEGNGALADVAALDMLERLEGALVIRNNEALASLELGALATVGGAFVLERNPRLVDLGALAAITAIQGDLRVEQNDQLERLFEREPRVGGDLSVRDNPALRQLGWLSASGASADLRVVDNPSLESVELQVQGDGPSLHVVGNGRLERVELLAPLRMDTLSLRENPELRSLDVGALGPTVVNDLQLTDSRLVSLNSVHLAGVACFVQIARNAELESLWSASRPPPLSATALFITENPRLPSCAARAWVERQQQPGGDLGPRTGCDLDPQQVQSGSARLVEMGNDDDVSCQ